MKTRKLLKLVSDRFGQWLCALKNCLVQWLRIAGTLSFPKRYDHNLPANSETNSEPTKDKSGGDSKAEVSLQLRFGLVVTVAVTVALSLLVYAIIRFYLGSVGIHLEQGHCVEVIECKPCKCETERCKCEVEPCECRTEPCRCDCRVSIDDLDFCKGAASNSWLCKEKPTFELGVGILSKVSVESRFLQWLFLKASLRGAESKEPETRSPKPTTTSFHIVAQDYPLSEYTVGSNPEADDVARVIGNIYGLMRFISETSGWPIDMSLTLVGTSDPVEFVGEINYDDGPGISCVADGVVAHLQPGMPMGQAERSLLGCARAAHLWRAVNEYAGGDTNIPATFVGVHYLPCGTGKTCRSEQTDGRLRYVSVGVTVSVLGL